MLVYVFTLYVQYVGGGVCMTPGWTLTVIRVSYTPCTKPPSTTVLNAYLGYGSLETTSVLLCRVKSIFKLAQGEYVTPSHLETLFADNTSYINQVYVYGNSLWDHVVAVVVPNMATIKEWWKREGGGEC